MLQSCLLILYNKSQELNYVFAVMNATMIVVESTRIIYKWVILSTLMLLIGNFFSTKCRQYYPIQKLFLF